ncbi:MAG: sigma-70 family RNA polymerase sigma factor [Candidatus Methylomirabilales bacterium]
MSFSLDLLKRYLPVKMTEAEEPAPFQHEAVKHLTSLYNFALGLTRNNQDDAADLVQETYLRAVRFQNRFRPGTNLRAWLFKILRNVYIDSYWRRSREPAMEDLEREGGSATVAEVEGVYGREAGPLNRLVRIDLNQALEDLPEPFRTAILLSDIEGLGIEEIAEIMDSPRNTVKTRLFRGRGLLRQRLKDYGN